MSAIYVMKGATKKQHMVTRSPVHNEHIAAECFREVFHVHPRIIINQQTDERFKVIGACLKCHAVVTDKDDSEIVETRLFHAHHVPALIEA